MRIGLIAPPFIAVPPLRYGGTELFLGHLARALHARGHDVTVYANGDSRLPCRVKSCYEHSEWPLDDPATAHLKNAEHTSWAIEDARRSVDIIHLNDVVGLPFTRFTNVPAVYTIHHPHEPTLSRAYLRYPHLHYVAIAHWLARAEPMPSVRVVHHGIPTSDYRFTDRKGGYVAFLGRIAPCKGTHLAIEAARRAGVPIKVAGEIQPTFHDYWENSVRPLVDGRDVEYVGEADHQMKCDLLAGARALLFPIQWDEPFGLVMIEAMACGTPVLAFKGGSVVEVVRNGVNGWICADVDEMARRLHDVRVSPASCRAFVERRFSVERMADDYLRIYASAIEAQKPHGQRVSPHDGVEPHDGVATREGTATHEGIAARGSLAPHRGLAARKRVAAHSDLEV
jgi:glycosyltransferase involved in cell wall biosynthesis